MNGWIGIVGVLALCGLTACAEGEEEPKVADDSDVTELIEETDSTSDNEGGDASETDEPADTDASNSDDTVDNPADVDGDGYESIAAGGTDCNDANDAINPGAEEIYYDGVDQNCDGLSDYDQDGDGVNALGFGGLDCDDLNISVYPGAPDPIYDGVDQNCDGLSDFDQDGDGVDAQVYGGTDCNDLNGSIFPGAAEIYYDGVDQNCDGLSDFDQDGDGINALGFGGLDCDDLDLSVYPGAAEVYYDGVDQNCDGLSDYDQDGDGVDSEGYGGTDCNDLNLGIYPGATQVPCDGIDQNCSGLNDLDQDGDGYLSEQCGGNDCYDLSDEVYPGAPDDPGDFIDSSCSFTTEHTNFGFPLSTAEVTFERIPKGSFTMGCEAGRDDINGFSCSSDELPAHDVELTRDFYIMTMEVTRGQFFDLVGYDPGSSGSWSHPVMEMNWDVAAYFANQVSLLEGLPECYTCIGTPTYQSQHNSTFCTSPADIYACEGFRLPTEAEWEYAARGGEDHQFAGSDTAADVAWYTGNTSNVQPGCGLLANGFGLCDMTGNARNFTNDLYNASYYALSPGVDPQGPLSGNGHTVRGSSYQSYEPNVRVAERITGSVCNFGCDGVGIRLARTAPTPPESLAP